MAKTSRRLECNVAGDFFVDDSCIDCGACRWLAPQSFDREGEYAFVAHQPDDAVQTDAVLAALVACPVGAIGGGGRQVAEAARRFPLLWPGVPAGHGVYAVGFHSRDTFGAASWLIVRPGGNVLVDCPRYDGHLADRIDRLGGVHTLFLTHRDDVAGHERWADRFGAERILHAGDVADGTAMVERPIHGTDPIDLADDLRLLPVPGHTEGHLCLLYRDRYLFTGDHLAFANVPHGQPTGLIAFDRFCWYDWREQTASMARLAEQPFEWVFPGHGAPGYLSGEAMRADLVRLVAWMATRNLA